MPNEPELLPVVPVLPVALGPEVLLLSELATLLLVSVEDEVEGEVLLVEPVVLVFWLVFWLDVLATLDGDVLLALVSLLVDAPAEVFWFVVLATLEGDEALVDDLFVWSVVAPIVLLVPEVVVE